MFTYSFAIKLTDRTIDTSSPEAVFEIDNRGVKVERMADDVFLISSQGYPSKSAAEFELVSMMMKVKITLLKLKIPHQDWLSFNDDQRSATEAIGSMFIQANIVPISYQPQAYESARHTHWPAAAPAAVEFVLSTLGNIALPDSEFNFGTVRTLEALTVLGLALAAPHAKSKLILSMTAVEILITRDTVEQNIVDALDELRDRIPEIDCTPELSKKLEKVLDDAKRESISKAGKRLVKTYLGGQKAKKFYDLYDVRSQLVHGNPSRLTIDLDGHADIEKFAEQGFNLALELTLAFNGEEQESTGLAGTEQ